LRLMSSRSLQLALYATALLALVFSVVFWKGLGGLLQNHMFTDNVVRELLYLLGGVLLFFLTNTPFGDTDERERQRERTRRDRSSPADGDALMLPMHPIMHYLRLTIGLCAAVLVWSALEQLYEFHLGIAPSVWREFGFIMVGLVLVLLTNSLMVSSGLMTPLWLVGQPADEDRDSDFVFGYGPVATDERERHSDSDRDNAREHDRESPQPVPAQENGQR